MDALVQLNNSCSKLMGLHLYLLDSSTKDVSLFCYPCQFMHVMFFVVVVTILLGIELQGPFALGKGVGGGGWVGLGG